MVAAAKRRMPPPLKLDPALMASAQSAMCPSFQLAPCSDAWPRPACRATRIRATRGNARSSPRLSGSAKARPKIIPCRTASCWDPHWAKNYGGIGRAGAAQRTADYIPAAFIPRQNPFYVALPYNDMEHGAHKAEATKVIPVVCEELQGPSKSVCKGRWIAIRFGNKVATRSGRMPAHSARTTGSMFSAMSARSRI